MKRAHVLALVRTLEGVEPAGSSQPSGATKCMSKEEAIEALLALRRLAGLPAERANGGDAS